MQIYKLIVGKWGDSIITQHHQAWPKLCEIFGKENIKYCIPCTYNICVYNQQCITLFHMSDIEYISLMEYSK